MPVMIVENEKYGNRAFCTLNEGLGKVLRYGAYGEEVTRRLKWMETILYPVLKDALAHSGPIDLKNMIAQALHMGDEVHNRNRAGTSLFYRAITPSIVATCADQNNAIAVLNFINGNDHFFLNLSMPACKAVLDAARDVPASSIAVVMARNGTDFGVQLAGTGDLWFTAPPKSPTPSTSPDSPKKTPTPTSATAPSPKPAASADSPSPPPRHRAIRRRRRRRRPALHPHHVRNHRRRIPHVSNPRPRLPRNPTGIDVRKVVEKNILPVIDTGVAHKEAGIGQVGAGIVNAPMGPFAKAYEALAKLLK